MVRQGDLVKFEPPEHIAGALTAVKFFARLMKKCTPEPGLVLSIHEPNARVLFGECVELVHMQYLQVVKPHDDEEALWRVWGDY